MSDEVPEIIAEQVWARRETGESRVEVAAWRSRPRPRATPPGLE